MAEMPKHILENLEFLHREIERLPRARHLPRHEIHLQVTMLKLEDLMWPPATQERPNSGEQLRYGEGLHEIVVRAAVQPPHAIVDGVLRREDQHGRLKATLTERRQDFEAVALREHEIEDDAIEGLVIHEEEPFFARGGNVNVVVLGLQPLTEGSGDFLFIFDHEHAHGTPHYIGSRSPPHLTGMSGSLQWSGMTTVVIIVTERLGLSAEEDFGMTRMVALLALVLTATVAVAAGETTTMKYDLGAENPKWKFVAGAWMRRPSGGRQVLAQTVETQPWAVALLEDKKFSDVDVSVRFRPVSGREDASGGIIFRAKDGQNYLLVRANALENNFRLYTMINGKRSTIASARVNEPKLGIWHTIRVVATGSKVEAYLDGARLLDHEDKTFTEGWIGLWTKADSVTEFADLDVTGTVAR
jgi:Domain of Unknown Function (DUF1080)